MKVLIRSARLIAPQSPLNGQIKNILIADGVISEITDSLPAADELVEGDNLCLSPGWFDMNCYVGDPGFEHKEDIESVCNAAATGGFTEIACLPSTKPFIQTKDVIEYIKSKSSRTTVNIRPMAALTLNTKGEELTEMIDLHVAGAVAFTDADHSVWHSDILLKAIQYNQKFNGLVIQRPEDKHLSAFGQMNEGKVSTMIGLKGIPALSEEVIVARDLRILEYTGGKLHFAQISTPAAVNMIKEAKKKGLNVTCDIAAHHLALDESELNSFDTNFKVQPPLRTKKDVDFFRKAFKEGVIDAVVSAHRPQDPESKNLEFDLSEFGMIGLETVYKVLATYLPDLENDQLVEKLAYAPRRILNLDIPEIKVGEVANLTVFSRNGESVYEKSSIRSKSKNSAFLGKKLKGKVIATVNNRKLFLNKNV